MAGLTSLKYPSLLALLALHCHAVPLVSSPTTTVTSTPTLTATNVAVTNVTSHGTFTGPPATTTGALSTRVLAPFIPAKPPEPYKLAYQPDGRLHAPLPAPYTPSGGLGTNGSEPVYRVQSDFDFQSIALGLYQEWIELDLFHHGLAIFSEDDFRAAGLGPEDRFLLQFMAEQEVGHATVLSNMLGLGAAPVQCAYAYPRFADVREYVDFSQKLTRWGEAGVYGFLNHLDAREVGQILLQSITTEARQQLVFRQFEGLFPMPVWFEMGIPQSWAWTLLAPYIASCPENQTRLVWQNFPALRVLNQPNPARVDGAAVWRETLPDNGGANVLSTANISDKDACVNATGLGRGCAPGISRNRTIPLSYPGRQVFLEWDLPGKPVGPNNSYVTSSTAGPPRFAAWVSQLNVTYTPLLNVSRGSAYTIQPNVSTFEGNPAVNDTIFLALTDRALPVTPFNLSLVNPFVNALAMYQAG